MDTILQDLSHIFSFLFVLGTMFNLGFTLTPSQIAVPLKNANFVVRILLINFAVVPVVTYLLVSNAPMDHSVKVGFALLALCAGSPFMPKAVIIAKGNPAMSAGALILLMLGTIFLVPLLLPVVLHGVEVDSWQVAKNLILSLLLPLGLALLIHARHKQLAETYAPFCSQLSNVSLIGMMVMLIGINWDGIISMFGTGVVLSLILFVIINFTISFFLAPSKSGDDRKVFSFSGTLRNTAAALVVAASAFPGDAKVLVFIITGSIIMTFSMSFVAAEWGKRTGDNTQAR